MADILHFGFGSAIVEIPDDIVHILVVRQAEIHDRRIAAMQVVDRQFSGRSLDLDQFGGFRGTTARAGHQELGDIFAGILVKLLWIHDIGHTSVAELPADLFGIAALVDEIRVQWRTGAEIFAEVIGSHRHVDVDELDPLVGGVASGEITHFQGDRVFPGIGVTMARCGFRGRIAVAELPEIYATLYLRLIGEIDQLARTGSRIAGFHLDLRIRDDDVLVEHHAVFATLIICDEKLHIEKADRVVFVHDGIRSGIGQGFAVAEIPVSPCDAAAHVHFRRIGETNFQASAALTDIRIQSSPRAAYHDGRLGHRLGTTVLVEYP